MKKWNHIIISVDYWAMDPGISHFDSERTTLARGDVHEGDKLPYRDPSGLLAGITVTGLGPDYLTIQVGIHEHTLHTGEGMTLDRRGRDYTNFELCIRLEP